MKIVVNMEFDSLEQMQSFFTSPPSRQETTGAYSPNPAVVVSVAPPKSQTATSASPPAPSVTVSEPTAPPNGTDEVRVAMDALLSRAKPGEGAVLVRRILDANGLKRARDATPEQRLKLIADFNAQAA